MALLTFIQIRVAQSAFSRGGFKVSCDPRMTFMQQYVVQDHVFLTLDKRNLRRGFRRGLLDSNQNLFSLSNLPWTKSSVLHITSVPISTNPISHRFILAVYSNSNLEPFGVGYILNNPNFVPFQLNSVSRILCLATTTRRAKNSTWRISMSLPRNISWTMVDVSAVPQDRNIGKIATLDINFAETSRSNGNIILSRS